jgi:hypothetical protein
MNARILVSLTDLGKAQIHRCPIWFSWLSHSGERHPDRGELKHALDGASQVLLVPNSSDIDSEGMDAGAFRREKRNGRMNRPLMVRQVV